MKSLPIALLLLSSIGFAAPLINEPVAELHLTSGKVLYDVQAKGFAQKTVLVKHREGAETIPYDQFPAEYKDQLIQKRPQPPKVSDAPTPSTPAPKVAMTPTKPASRARVERNVSPVQIRTSSVGPYFTTVEIGNELDQQVEVTPNAVTAETSSGSTIHGRQWVAGDNDGKITSTLKQRQTIDPHSSVTLRVVFEPTPAGEVISRVFLPDLASK